MAERATHPPLPPMKPSQSAFCSSLLALFLLVYFKRAPGFKDGFDVFLSGASISLFSHSQMVDRFTETAGAAASVLEAEAMRWGSTSRLHDWSWHDGFTNRGVQEYERVMRSQDLLGEPVSSLQKLLYAAEAAGLFSP